MLCAIANEQCVMKEKHITSTLRLLSNLSLTHNHANCFINVKTFRATMKVILCLEMLWHDKNLLTMDIECQNESSQTCLFSMQTANVVFIRKLWNCNKWHARTLLGNTHRINKWDGQEENKILRKISFPKRQVATNQQCFTVICFFAGTFCGGACQCINQKVPQRSCGDTHDQFFKFFKKCHNCGKS